MTQFNVVKNAKESRRPTEPFETTEKVIKNR